MEEHNHEEALESDFEKRLLEMELRAANWINSQLSSLNDAQKVEYDRRLSVAYSLIEPYRLSKKELASDTNNAATRSHECYICKKTFAEKSYMKKHFQYVHKGEKAFQCTICESSFSVRSKLKR